MKTLLDFEEVGLLLDLPPELARMAWLSVDEGFPEAIGEGPRGLLFDLRPVLHFGYERLKRRRPQAVEAG